MLTCGVCGARTASPLMCAACGRSWDRALVAPWSATHGTEYTVARAEAAGLEVVVRRFGG